MSDELARSAIVAILRNFRLNWPLIGHYRSVGGGGCRRF